MVVCERRRFTDEASQLRENPALPKPEGLPNLGPKVGFVSKSELAAEQAVRRRMHGGRNAARVSGESVKWIGGARHAH